MVRVRSRTSALKPHQFSRVETKDTRQRVKPVDTGNDVLQFQFMQAAGWQDELSAAKPRATYRNREGKLEVCREPQELGKAKAVHLRYRRRTL